MREKGVVDGAQMNDERFSQEVLRLLSKAGWSPGRRVPVLVEAPGFEMFDIARQTLEEFGGLAIGEQRAGEQLARDVLEFGPTEFIGLREALLEDEPLSDARTEEGYRVFPVGRTCSSHIVLLVDEVGRVYQYYDRLERLGDTIGEGFANVLLGRFYKADPPDSCN